MPIKYDKLLKLLEDKGYTSYRIRKEKVIGQATLTAIKNGTGGLDHRSISRLCEILGCQPGDIMEYVPATLDTEPDTATMRMYKTGPNGWVDEEK